jgi:hypothetical protein
MLLKLAALGALGYAGYRYYRKNKGSPRIALAGGPLSDQAKLQPTADMPPTI